MPTYPPKLNLGFPIRWWFAIIVASIALGAYLGPVAPFLTLFALYCFFFIRWLVGLWRKASSSHLTAAKYEAEYAARQDLKSEMIAIAEDVYQKSPVGNCR